MVLKINIKTTRENKMKKLPEFKKGDQVTYLGYKALITKVSTDVQGRYRYSVAYDKGNGRAKVSDHYNKDQAIQK